jgi:hypothetical protein
VRADQHFVIATHASESRPTFCHFDTCGQFVEDACRQGACGQDACGQFIEEQ